MFSFRKWRYTIFGVLLVLGGVVSAFLTWVAGRIEDWALMRLSAITSLVFVALIMIFVVPPLTRSARAEATQLDLPVQFTSGGLIFGAILFVVAFAAWNTGNNLLFLIFSVLASALFVAWSAARAVLREVVVSARFPDHIFAGEPAPVIVTLHNRKSLLPSFSILIEARSRIMEEEATKKRRWARARFVKRALAYFIYVPHRAKAEQRIEQVFAKRGHVLITGFELSTRFPFGFFRMRRRLRARDVDLIIYPKPEPASDELHLLPINAGRIASARRGAGHDLHSLREYQPQDDMRHIDWKATARTSRLIVREFTAEDERRVHIALDTRIDGQNGEGKHSERFERGVTLAASLVSHFTDERAEVRLTLGDEAGRYGTGREHLYDCLRRLALVAPSREHNATKREEQFWEHLAPTSPAANSNYTILLTTAAPGTIPAHVWRKSHVIYL